MAVNAFNAAAGPLQGKQCSKCGRSKPVTEFYKARDGLLGVRADCKQCCRARALQWHRGNPERTKENCKKFRIENPNYMSAWYNNNKEKVNDRASKWHKEHPDKVSKKTKKWRDKNPDYYSVWHKKNPGKHSLYSKNYRDKKILEDPRYKLDEAISSGVRRGLKLGGKSGRSTYILLGYTSEALKSHLEKQFRNGMSWENYGEWHVDHIIPLSAHNYETPDDPDFKRAWALENLQPLWADENMKKGSKILQEYF